MDKHIKLFCHNYKYRDFKWARKYKIHIVNYKSNNKYFNYNSMYCGEAVETHHRAIVTNLHSKRNFCKKCLKYSGWTMEDIKLYFVKARLQGFLNAYTKQSKNS